MLIKQPYDQGFTLVELITVIIILGILSALAVPRFINVSIDAQKAVARTTSSAFHSAVMLAHSHWQVKGTNSEVLADNGAFGIDINYNANGFPVDARDNTGGLNASIAGMHPNRCGRVWNVMLSHSPVMHTSGDGNPNTWYAASDDGLFKIAFNTSNTCTFQLVNDTSISIIYNTTTGAVTYNE